MLDIPRVIRIQKWKVFWTSCTVFLLKLNEILLLFPISSLLEKIIVKMVFLM